MQTRNALNWEQTACFQQFDVLRNSTYVYFCSGDLDLEQVTLAKCKENQTYLLQLITIPTLMFKIWLFTSMTLNLNQWPQYSNLT